MDHNPVDLDLALRMQGNPSLIDRYLVERIEIIKILKLIREHSNGIVLIMSILLEYSGDIAWDAAK
jgi:hypothetical protein